MNQKEYFLNQLMEEAGEVVQAASKQKRFGGYHPWPGKSGLNREELRGEVLDLLATVEILVEIGELDPVSSADGTKQRERKRAKMVSMMDLSRQLGFLDP